MELKFRVSMRDDDGDSNQASKPVKKRGKMMLPKGLMQKRQTSSQVKIKQPEKRETEELHLSVNEKRPSAKEPERFKTTIEKSPDLSGEQQKRNDSDGESPEQQIDGRISTIIERVD